MKSVNSVKSTNVIEIIANGPYKDVPIQLEADTGVNITVLKAIYLEDLDRVEIEDTDMHIQGTMGKQSLVWEKHRSISNEAIVAILE